MMKFSDVVSLVDAMNTDVRIGCHNVYCQNQTMPDDTIYSMDEFNELMSDSFDPLRICFMMHYGEFNPHDDWFAFDGNGNLKSFGTRYDIAEYCESSEELAKDILNNPADYDLYIEVEVDAE